METIALIINLPFFLMNSSPGLHTVNPHADEGRMAIRQELAEISFNFI